MGCWDSALVGAALDTLFADLAGGIHASVSESVLYASGPWASFVALLAGFLTIDYQEEQKTRRLAKRALDNEQVAHN